MTENEISYIIRGAIFKVYSSLGAGLFESVYENALTYQIRKDGCSVTNQVAVPVYYDGIKMRDIGFRLDMLVEKKVIVEIKSVDMLSDVHFKQLHTYLNLTDKRLGILVNFASVNIAKSIHRIVNRL